jgi:hypothetical protein
VFTIETNKLTRNQLNSFQIALTVAAMDSSILIPAGIPGYELSQPDERSQDMGLSLISHLPEVRVEMGIQDDGMSR